MKELIIILLTILMGANSFAQQNPTEQAQPIVEEGKRLYKSEMASWHGTDLFLEQYTNQENIGGYFSYSEEDTSKCVFFSKEDIPKIIGTIAFDSTFNTETAIIDIKERKFSKIEEGLYEIRNKALNLIQSDTLFKLYENTNFNLIPIIHNKEKKVYILTGPSVSGVVIFGNDYLITFDEENEIVDKKQLHKNLIPIEYGEEREDGQIVVGAVHSHLPETGEFITATDICTLMLYAKYAQWKSHNVVSEKYLNIWNCETNTLTVISMDAVRAMDNHQEKKEKRGKKK
ncbi:MAG: hypothetical protein R3E32_10045 [Chitinophagales bacterium]